MKNKEIKIIKQEPQMKENKSETKEYKWPAV